MDSWRYEDDDEADEYGDEDDEFFRRDLEALRRACMLTGAGDDYDAGTPDRVLESGNESEEIDDMEFLRSIQNKLCIPIDVNARNSGGSSDLDEDDFETLRAIERRFAKYDDDEAKKKASSLMQHGSETNRDASLHSVIGSSNPATPLTSGHAYEDHPVDATEHVPVDDELPSTAVVPLKKSHFSDSVRVFIEAVKKNRMCQQFIRSKLMQIEAMLSENKELCNRVKCLVDFQMSCSRQAKRFLHQESSAHVKLISLPDARKHSKNSQEEKICPLFLGPRENSHVPLFRRVLSKFPSALKRRPWSIMEGENLAKGVKQQIQEFLLCNSMQRFCGSEEDLTQPNFLDSAVEEISSVNISPQHIRSFLPQVDWNRLAYMYLKDRSGAECWIRWLNNEDPLINHSPWSKDEDKRLLFIVQQGGPYNWIHIAELLGTNRTVSQCLSRYQRSLNVNILRGDWTEEEDAQLRAAVEAFGENDWQLVASHLEGRTGNQCSNRWRKCLHPSKERFGRWTVEEDKRLKIAVTLFGPRAWKKISGFIPGRTQVQCRERWIHSLDPSLRLDVWTEEEDMKLRDAIAECGLKWSKVAACIPGRTNGQCRRRWKVLFPEELSRAQTAQKIKKRALISNFVSRKKERPALGPDDFVPVPGDAITVYAENGNVGKPNKRGSRSKGGDKTLSISKSHKKVKRKVNSTSRELALHEGQGSNGGSPEAADGDESSLTQNLHKRIKKRKKVSIGKEIILRGDTDIFTCENGCNPKEDGRTQLGEGNAALVNMDDRVGARDGHCEASEEQFLHKAQSVVNGEAGSCDSRNKLTLMQKSNSKEGTLDLGEPFQEQVIAPKDVCELPAVGDVGSLNFVKATTETADGDQALSISKSHKRVRRKVSSTSRELVLRQGPQERFSEAAVGDKTSVTCNLHKRVERIKETSTGKPIILQGDASIFTCENGGNPKEDGRARLGEGNADLGGMDDRVSVRDSHCRASEDQFLHKTKSVIYSGNRENGEDALLATNGACDVRISVEGKCSDNPQPVSCRRSRAKSGKTTIETSDNDQTLSMPKCHKKVERKVHSTGREPVLHQEPNDRSLKAADGDETSNENVVLESQNLETKRSRAVRSESVESNEIGKPPNRELALVKDSVFLDHRKENDSRMPRARRTCRKNVNYRDMVNDNVGLLNSHNLQTERLEVVLTECLESDGVQKQLNSDAAVTKDLGCVDHGKESGDRTQRPRRASRENDNYRDMVDQNVGLAVPCEGIKSIRELNRESALVKDWGCLDHGKENGDRMSRATRASGKDVDYRDMVNGNADLLDWHNLEGEGLEAVPYEGIESNGVEKQLNREPALVKNSGCLDHGEENVGRMPRASKTNVNNRDMVNENVGLLDSHNLEGERLGAVTCERIESNEVQKQQLNRELATVEDSGCLDHGKENVGRVRRASRNNFNYRDMVNGKVGYLGRR